MNADCDSGETCSSGQCVGEGALRFTLSWSASADLDLYVTTPTGATISYSNRSADTGQLDVDNTSGGAGSIENVFFVTPPNGNYEYWVDHFGGDSAAFSVQVAKNGSVAATQSGNLSTGESTHWTIGAP